ncbi:hypothetical protein EMIT051CA3_60161 [Pseudomonas chlororaphis]
MARRGQLGVMLDGLAVNLQQLGALGTWIGESRDRHQCQDEQWREKTGGVSHNNPCRIRVKRFSQADQGAHPTP